MSEWASTYVPILGCSEPPCFGPRPWHAYPRKVTRMVIRDNTLSHAGWHACQQHDMQINFVLDVCLDVVLILTSRRRFLGTTSHLISSNIIFVYPTSRSISLYGESVTFLFSDSFRYLYLSFCFSIILSLLLSIAISFSVFLPVFLVRFFFFVRIPIF